MKCRGVDLEELQDHISFIKKHRGLDLEEPSQRVDVLHAELPFAGQDLRDGGFCESSSGRHISLGEFVSRTVPTRISWI